MNMHGKQIRHRGYSLIEVIVSVVVLGVLGAVLVPMLGAAKFQQRSMSSSQKLLTIGQMGMMYAQDNADRLFSYSWRAGETYIMPSGVSRLPPNDQDAASYQNQEILMRRTGRILGQTKFLNFTARLPHRRYSHLVLMDYMNSPFPSDLFIDPSDANLQMWASDPLNYGPGSGVPYADGYQAGYDAEINWVTETVRQRWPFASSYQAVPDAWQPSRGARYIPVSSTPHLLTPSGSAPDGFLSNGRRLSEVLHNANKVWIHEEFDRDRADPLYFGYDEAQADKLMFDGSVNNWASGIAAPSVVPELGQMHWQQAYVPLDTFPVPVGGLGDNTLVSQRYRWTYGGLSGINYGSFSFDRAAKRRD